MGRAIGGLAKTKTSAHYEIVECSNMGVCDRMTGTCKCNSPFTGAACNLCKFMLRFIIITCFFYIHIPVCIVYIYLYKFIFIYAVECPSSTSQTCSGHGICLNMQELAKHQPVVTPPNWPRNTTQTTIIYGVNKNESNYTTWDAKNMRGCKCDSSWEVGYEWHQRQLGEYFGADCSLSM